MSKPQHRSHAVVVNALNGATHDYLNACLQLGWEVWKVEHMPAAGGGNSNATNAFSLVLLNWPYDEEAKLPRE